MWYIFPQIAGLGHSWMAKQYETVNLDEAKAYISCTYQACCNCFKEREGIVVNTIHGVKGEEYTTVIAFDLLNGHLPHWDYIIDEDKKCIGWLKLKDFCMYYVQELSKICIYLVRKGVRLKKAMSIKLQMN